MEGKRREEPEGCDAIENLGRWCGLTYGVNRRCRSGAVGGDVNSKKLVGEVAHRGNVRVERLVRPDGETPHTRERAWMLGFRDEAEHETPECLNVKR